jgi:hypothetical protein
MKFQLLLSNISVQSSKAKWRRKVERREKRREKKERKRDFEGKGNGW